MSDHATDWTPVLLVLGCAVAAGLTWLWRLRSAPIPQLVPAQPLEVRDLEGRRDTLLQQLRDLHEMPEAWGAQQVQQRLALELEAARVLLALEEQAPVAVAPAPEPASAPAPSSALAGFAWGVGTAGAFALLLFFVSRQAAPRTEGGSVTGGFESGAPVAGDGDVDAALERARAALERQDMMAVWNETQEVLRVSPGHPQALSYQALVRLAMGQGDTAEQLLKQALAASPDYAEGYLHLALVYARTGRRAEADAVLADAEKRFPQDAALIRRAAQEIRSVAADGPAGPGAAPAEPAAPAAASADGISGRVEFAGPVPPGAVLFVFARAEGQSAGPPAAVKRLTPSAFPVAFTLGAGDSMMGQALPARVRLDARLDSDGNPLTRPPTDPTASVDGVAVGTGDVRLTLAAR